jgi:hypothetical protein
VVGSSWKHPRARRVIRVCLLTKAVVRARDRACPVGCTVKARVKSSAIEADINCEWSDVAYARQVTSSSPLSSGMSSHTLLCNLLEDTASSTLSRSDSELGISVVIVSTRAVCADSWRMLLGKIHASKMPASRFCTELCCICG